MRRRSFQLILTFSFLFFFNAYFLTNAQLIEQWRVDIPSIPDFSAPDWHYDEQGNAYGIRNKYISSDRWAFNITKVSAEGILEWQIEDTPFLGGAYVQYKKACVDRYGNVYLLGKAYDYPIYQAPCVVKYSPDGVKLFQEIVEPNGFVWGETKPFDIAAWGADSDGIISAFGTYDVQIGSYIVSYGIVMSISPDGGNMAEYTLSDGMHNINFEDSNGPKGPDINGNYVARFSTLTSDNKIIAYLLGTNGTSGILWSFTSPPLAEPDPHFDLTNFRIFQSGNMYYNPYPYNVIEKYTSNYQYQWIKNYSYNNVRVISENPFDESVFIYEPNEIQPLACYNYDGTPRWSNSFALDYFRTAYGSGHDIYTITGYNNPAPIMRINYLTGEPVWVDTIEVGSGSYSEFGEFLLEGDSAFTIAGSNLVIKYIQGLEITKPVVGDKFIAGERDTIKWKGGREGEFIKLKYSTDSGNNFELIDAAIPENDTSYVWDVPIDLLTTKAIIRIEKNDNSELLAESEQFKIKPYIITRLDANRNYIAYDINTDRWGFGNTKEEMWPVWWWLRFNYIAGKDPFTNLYYPQHFCDSIFAKTKFSDRPDWISFVKTFGVNACYINTAIGSYRTPALQYWKSIKKKWGGSCFGIAIANALAFEKRNDFFNKYTHFPSFNNPIEVQSDTNVIPVIMELFTHQYGNPHQDYRNTTGVNKTPTETIRDLKAMLQEDSVAVRTLSMVSNSTNLNNQGGHAILAYKLEQDDTNPELYYVYVYDNSYPNILDTRILVDTSDNGGVGLWDPEYAWDGWEGDKWFYLRDPANSYLTNDILPKGNGYKSPFTLNENELNIYTNNYSYIIIEDNSGNQTGYANNGLVLDIPNSIPLIVEDGSLGPPYGYHLQTDNYSVVMNNFLADTINTFFFTGNKSFEYERYGANQNQTDRLYYDGGVSVTNPDNELKKVKILNLVSDTSQIADRLIVIRSLDLGLNDSVKIENIENEDIKLISYGSSKAYGIGLEFTSENNYQIFGNSNVELLENTTHIFDPDWLGVSTSELIVYVDIGNNGTIDDTLYLNNTVGVEDQETFLSPNNFNLAQNYPNPFNNSTVIKYSIPKEGLVTLKVFNIIGEELGTLVSEVKQAGDYQVSFNAGQLPSGVYFYQLSTDSYLDTKKMLLLK